jgi:hypothetical protein
MVKSQLESSDLLPVGTRDSAYGGSYKPTMVKYSDLAAQILAGVPPLTIGITPIASGTAGKLLYEGAGNVLNESPVFNIDPLTGFLGVNTTTPQFAIDMQFSTLGFYSDPTYNAYFGLNNGGLYLSSHTRFVFNTSLANSALTIEQSGNILINTGFDAGFKLDVNGTARFTGQFSSGANINFQIRQNSGNPNFQVRGDGYVQFNNYTPLSGGTMNVLDGSRISMFGGGPLSGNINQFSMSHLFQTNDSSHTYTGVLISTTINQTGGASGITRGLYVNPTLTAAADFRAIETTAGNVIFNGGNVGIGTSSPAYVLDVVGGFRIGSSTIKLGMGESGGNSVFVGSLTNQPLKFLVNTNEYARIATTGNVLINTTGDSGFRLDVNGTARVQGLITGTAGITISGSSSFTSGYLGIASTGSGGIYGLTANQPLYIWNRQTSTGNGIVIDDFNGVGANSISLNLLNISGSYNTSGTCVHNTLMISRAINMPLGNQTVRGFYYNPTLTNTTGLVAHFAFHSTSGRVRFEGLPTSSAGLSSGDIWNDGGIVKIV